MNHFYKTRSLFYNLNVLRTTFVILFYRDGILQRYTCSFKFSYKQHPLRPQPTAIERWWLWESVPHPKREGCITFFPWKKTLKWVFPSPSFVLIPWHFQQGANFRNLPGVLVDAKNKVYLDPSMERVLISSGKPLVPDYAITFVRGTSSKYVKTMSISFLLLFSELGSF